MIAIAHLIAEKFLDLVLPALASLPEMEGAAGLVNLEANACGIPIVASGNGGIPEYVEGGHTGFLFAPGDHREVPGCVLKLLEDNGLYRTMCEQARERAEYVDWYHHL